MVIVAKMIVFLQSFDLYTVKLADLPKGFTSLHFVKVLVCLPFLFCREIITTKSHFMILVEVVVLHEMRQRKTGPGCESSEGFTLFRLQNRDEIGRASCRERV